MNPTWSEPEHHLLAQLLRQKLQHSCAPCAVLCLCAQWCGVCREFRATFEAAQQLHPDWLFEFVDVEEQADQLGDLDIETFPTLVMGTASAIAFAGPILPQAGTLARHLRLLANHH